MQGIIAFIVDKGSAADAPNSRALMELRSHALNHARKASRELTGPYQGSVASHKTTVPEEYATKVPEEFTIGE